MTPATPVRPPWWRRDLLLKCFSLLFAVGLWLFVNLGERDAEKTLEVPLRLGSIPPAFVVTSEVSDSIDVRVRGPRTLLGTIEPQQSPLTLDLSRVRPGQTSFRFDTEMMSLPRGVRVQRISPSQIVLEVERVQERSVPVQADIGDEIPRGLRLVGVRVDPPRVRVRGPASRVAALESIKTRRPALPTIPGESPLEAVLAQTQDPLSLSPERVTLYVELEDLFEKRSFPGRPIALRGAAPASRVEDAAATVVLRGPVRLLDDLELAANSLYVDAEALAPGRHEATVQFETPEGFEAISISPKRVRVEIARPDTKAEAAPPQPDTEPPPTR